MNASLFTPSNANVTRGNHIEISVRGKWVRTPAFDANGQTIVVSGKWIKIAAVHDEEWMEHEIPDPEQCVKKAKEQLGATRADIFCFTQKPSATAPRRQYHLAWESIAVAQVTTFKDWWEKLPQETRKNVRRSHKRGVVIRLREFNDELVRGIADIQNECAVRQGRRYPHYGKTLNEVKRDHLGFVERSDFICAYFENEMIGFLKLVYRGDVASILQLNSKVAHHDKRPSNALLSKAVELCEERGIACLTYGNFNYGNKRDDSLREFKIRNGFCEVLVPRFYVPLTKWGSICVRARLYRGLLEMLPRSVITTLVSARAAWYDASLGS
jgi:hypothetical protein